MAACWLGVMRRLSAFAFAFGATDLVFGSSYQVPKVPRPLLRDRLNPIELYEDVISGAILVYEGDRARAARRASSDEKPGQPLTPMLQLLVVLRFYAYGTFQVVTGDLINVSQPAVCRTVNKVTGLIAKHLFREPVHFPQADEYGSVVQEFYPTGRFFGVTGCIDCTHVRIKSPDTDSAEVFRNRKAFSINVQVSWICCFQ